MCLNISVLLFVILLSTDCLFYHETFPYFIICIVLMLLSAHVLISLLVLVLILLSVHVLCFIIQAFFICLVFLCSGPVPPKLKCIVRGGVTSFIHFLLYII